LKKRGRRGRRGNGGEKRRERGIIWSTNLARPQNRSKWPPPPPAAATYWELLARAAAAKGKIVGQALKVTGINYTHHLCTLQR